MGIVDSDFDEYDEDDFDDDTGFLCLDCGIDTSLTHEYYMVTNAVWLKANPQSHGMLCIHDLSLRLGRKLFRSDFTDAPLNRPGGWKQSDYLLACISRKRGTECIGLNCTRPIRAKEMCATHYARVAATGSMMPNVKVYDIEEFGGPRQAVIFLSEPADDSDCWLWRGSRNERYGVMPSGGGAHIFAYEAWNGPVENSHVMHSCDNGFCVNPKHLSLGTHLQNMQDKVAKGRQTKGEQVNTAVLTEEQVVSIIKDKRLQRSHRLIADEYGVDESTIRAIRSGKTWKHLRRPNAKIST
jgi:hypothetical protein